MVMHSKRDRCDWQGYDEMNARAYELAAMQPGKFSPLLLLNWPISPQQLLTAARAFAQTYAA
jgi:hypothetical protein